MSSWIVQGVLLAACALESVFNRKQGDVDTRARSLGIAPASLIPVEVRKEVLILA